MSPTQSTPTSEPNGLIVQIINDSKGTLVVYVNGTSIKTGDPALEYTVQHPAITIERRSDGNVYITFEGTNSTKTLPATSYMCLCLLKEDTIQLTLAQSMLIAIGSNDPTLGVGCGDGGF